MQSPVESTDANETIGWKYILKDDENYSFFAENKNLLSKKEMLMRKLKLDPKGHPKVNTLLKVDDAFEGQRVRNKTITNPDGTKDKKPETFECLWYCVKKVKKTGGKNKKRQFTTIEECELEDARLNNFHHQHKTIIDYTEETHKHETELKRRKTSDQYDKKVLTKYEKDKAHLLMCQDFLKHGEQDESSGSASDTPTETTPPEQKSTTSTKKSNEDTTESIQNVSEGKKTKKHVEPIPELASHMLSDSSDSDSDNE